MIEVVVTTTGACG